MAHRSSQARSGAPKLPPVESQPKIMQLLERFRTTPPPQDKEALVALLRVIVSDIVMRGSTDLEHNIKSHMEEDDDLDNPFYGSGAEADDSIGHITARIKSLRGAQR